MRAGAGQLRSEAAELRTLSQARRSARGDVNDLRHFGYSPHAFTQGPKKGQQMCPRKPQRKGGREGGREGGSESEGVRERERACKCAPGRPCRERTWNPPVDRHDPGLKNRIRLHAFIGFKRLQAL